MALLKLFRGTQAELNDCPVSDGALLFATDTKKVYIDQGSQRIEVASVQDLGDYITETQLASALLGESTAREKQDELLQAAIDDKLDMSDLIEGDNITITPNLETGHVTISSVGGSGSSNVIMVQSEEPEDPDCKLWIQI